MPTQYAALVLFGAAVEHAEGTKGAIHADKNSLAAGFAHVKRDRAAVIAGKAAGLQIPSK